MAAHPAALAASTVWRGYQALDLRSHTKTRLGQP